VKLARQEPRQPDVPLRAYFDRAAVALFLQDELGTIVDLNRQACEGPGDARDELIGRSLRAVDAMPDRDGASAQANVAQMDLGVSLSFATGYRRRTAVAAYPRARRTGRRRRPGSSLIGAAGPLRAGAVGHLLAELFRTRTGVTINHVPYKGSAPAIADVIGGQVDLLFDPIVTIAPHVTAGKVKALAIAAPKRSPALPDVKTLSELGIQGVDNGAWFGLMVKAGTPEAVVRRLNEEAVKALTSPDVVKRFTDQGLEMLPGTPQDFGAFVKAETARWALVVKSSGATLD
jgi:tripartite tricarboxylate transporter family receptor